MKIWTKIARHLKHRATRIKTYLSVVLAAMIQYQGSFPEHAQAYSAVMLTITVIIGLIGGGLADPDQPAS